MKSSTTCRFCGAYIDPSDLLHVLNCDGRQGRVEAVIDAAESHRVTEAGIAQVERNARRDYLDMLVDGIRQVALDHATFASDDVHVVVGVRMREGNPSALGPAFRTAARLGYIRQQADRKDSARPSMHRKPLRIWESLIYRGESVAVGKAWQGSDFS